MMETYVITRKVEKNKVLFFYEYMFGLSSWGYEKDKAKKFSTKGAAKKHLPGLRHRRTRFGNHYLKGIKITTYESTKINPNWDIWYETKYIINGKKYLYRTKSYTDYHKQIHESKNVKKATTYKIDKNIEWEFGLYSEIIQKS